MDLDAPEHADFRRTVLDTYIPIYGAGWEEFASSAVYARIDPQKMFGAAFSPSDAGADEGVSLPAVRSVVPAIRDAT